MAWKQLIEPNLDPYIKQPDGKGGEYVLSDWLGYCLAYAEAVFGLKYLAHTATDAWGASKMRHTDRSFPSGVYFPVWFSHYGTYNGIYKNWGHVAVAYKHPATGALQIWSSPITRKPYADTWSSITEVEQKYRSTFIGWSEDIVGRQIVQSYVETPALKPNQRVVANADGVNGRAAPSTDSQVLKEYAKGDVLDFKGYVKGQTVNGNNVWFVGAYSPTYWWSGAFADKSTTGLQPLDTELPPPIETPIPIPPQPEMSPVFTKQLECVTSTAQVSTTNYQTDNFPLIPAGVVIHDFGTDGRDTLQSSLNQFKAQNTTAPHFVVSGDQIIQTGLLTWRMYHAGPNGNDKVGIEVDPDCDTNPVTQASVKTLLYALDEYFHTHLPRHLHSEFVATACGDDIPLELFTVDAMYPPAPPPPETTTTTTTTTTTVVPDKPPVWVVAWLKKFIEFLVGLIPGNK